MQKKKRVNAFNEQSL